MGEVTIRPSSDLRTPLLDSGCPEVGDGLAPLCASGGTARHLQHGRSSINTAGVYFKSFLQHNLGETFCTFFFLKRKLINSSNNSQTDSFGPLQVSSHLILKKILKSMIFTFILCVIIMDEVIGAEG